MGVAIQIQRGANAIQVVDEFYKRLEQLRKDIPSEYRLIVGFDFTQSVRESIKVEETLFIAFGLVVIIIFLFYATGGLLSFRSLPFRYPYCQHFS